MDDNDDCSSDPSKTYVHGVYGPRLNLFHVGDEYHIKIPTLIPISEYLEFTKNRFLEEEERKKGGPFDFLIGLDIPVVWINQVKMGDNTNVLLCEAVWPILLARGWHSEQPDGYNYAANGKNSLVFLMSGVKKYSIKLVKGDAYLDSVTGVLSKVASDPKLHELNGQNGVSETKVEEEIDLLDQFLIDLTII